MKKLILIIACSILLGIVAGFAVFQVSHWGVSENFEPMNMNSSTGDFRPSQ